MIMTAEDQELMEQWVQSFDPKDRLIAAIIFEEKPDVIIRREPNHPNKVNRSDLETRFIIITEEFAEEFWIESDLKIMEAIDFCYMFGVNYKLVV